jgi:hypothetical protein
MLEAAERDALRGPQVRVRSGSQSRNGERRQEQNVCRADSNEEKKSVVVA